MSMHSLGCVSKTTGKLAFLLRLNIRGLKILINSGETLDKVPIYGKRFA